MKLIIMATHTKFLCYLLAILLFTGCKKDCEQPQPQPSSGELATKTAGEYEGKYEMILNANRLVVVGPGGDRITSGSATAQATAMGDKLDLSIELRDVTIAGFQNKMDNITADLTIYTITEVDGEVRFYAPDSNLTLTSEKIMVDGKQFPIIISKPVIDDISGLNMHLTGSVTIPIAQVKQFYLNEKTLNFIGNPSDFTFSLSVIISDMSKK